MGFGQDEKGEIIPPPKDVKPPSSDPVVDWGFSCGRHYLKVAGYVVAMEGDTCRDGPIVSEVLGIDALEAFCGRHAWTEEMILLVVARAQGKVQCPNP
jgi:hypothetical protein